MGTGTPLEALGDLLTAEWRVVTGSFFYFVAAVALGWVAIWRLMEWRYRGEIERAKTLGTQGAELSIRQRGVDAGLVSAPLIDRSGKMVFFGHLYAAPQFDEHQTFEFQGMVLALRVHSMAGITQMGTAKRIIFMNVACEIVQ